MFYEALILEFEWISLTSDRTTQSSYCRCRHWPFRKIVEPNVEISASSRWRLGRSIQILWSTSTLLRSNPPFYNIIKLNILWRPIWTFIELRSPLRRNRSLSFILIGMLNKWFNSCVDFVILLLLFLLTYWIFEGADGVELAYSVLVQLINAFEGSFSYGFWMVRQEQAAEFRPLEEVFAVVLGARHC
jgi:hypothetical protein